MRDGRRTDAYGWVAAETGRSLCTLREANGKMLGWFQALMPREERFFQLFEKHATIVVAGAEALRGLLRGGDNIEACCKEIFQREAEADEITRQVLVAVRRTFITPFDRTDIQDLITSMDDAIDQMNKTAKTIVTFEVRVFEPCMQQMSEIIVQSAQTRPGSRSTSEQHRDQRRPPQRAHHQTHQCRGGGGRGLQSRPQGVVHRQSRRQCHELRRWLSAIRPPRESRRPL